MFMSKIIFDFPSSMSVDTQNKIKERILDGIFDHCTDCDDIKELELPVKDCGNHQKLS